jgi:hypothetical protein
MESQVMPQSVTNANQEEIATSSSTGRLEKVTDSVAAYAINTPDQEKAANIHSTKQAICHADRPRYGNSPFCRRCVDQVRWQGERGRAKLRAEIESSQSLSAAMKAEVIERIGAMTEYVRKPEEERRTVDTRKPSVRKHTGKVAILNNLDFDRAAAELKPDLRPHEQASLARKLESDPQVSREIQAQLSTRGLSDKDRDYFVSKLWSLFESPDPRQEQKSIAAMRLLGRAFISEKVENTEIEKLQIGGLEEGIARMTGGSDAAQEHANPFGELRRLPENGVDEE